MISKHKTVDESITGELVFHDQSFKTWETLQNRFKELGPDGTPQVGLIADPLPENEAGYRSIVHIANPFQSLDVDSNGKVTDNKTPLSIQSFPSYASVEEIDELRKQTIPMKETCEMLHALSETRAISNILLLEGDTAIGKTFTIEVFVKSIYGPDALPLDFYCNGQTDVSELQGMWAPKTTSIQEQERWKTFLESTEGREKLEAILDADSSIVEADITRRQATILLKLKQLAAEIGISQSASWEFIPGAVPKCFQAKFDPVTRLLSDTKGGRGFPLHIQEIGTAAPKVVNALLEIRGTNGRIKNSYQNWRNGGELIHRGEEGFIIMSTNPSDGTGFQQRNELDKALRRGIITLKYPNGLSQYSLNLAAHRYFTYQRDNIPERKPNSCYIELYNYPDDIGSMIGKVMGAFHQNYTTSMDTKNPRNSDAGSVVPSIDQMGRMADYILHCQVFDPKTGIPDLVETIRRGVDLIYLKGVTNQLKVQEQRNELDKLLKGESLAIRKLGRSVPPANVIQNAVKSAWEDIRAKGGQFSSSFISQQRQSKIMRLDQAVNIERENLLSNFELPSEARRALGKK